MDESEGVIFEGSRGKADDEKKKKISIKEAAQQIARIKLLRSIVIIMFRANCDVRRT